LRTCAFQQTTIIISEKSHKCYNKYVRAFTKRENTKIIAKLNNVYENFKIANLSQQNTKNINDKKSQNFQNLITFTIAIIKL